MEKIQPLPISVCLIAGNEAHRIARTLESVQGWTSEIILAIDDKVTDGTDKVAETFGAKVFSKPWEGQASHRNFTVKQASQPWLLSIDADEVISDSLRDEIIAAFQNHGNGSHQPPAAYSFPRLSYFCGRWIRHGDWYPDRKVRLWQKDTGQWEGIHHEKLVLRGRVFPLHGDLFHFSNEGIDHLLGKIASFSNLFVRLRQAENRHRPRWLDIAVRPFWKFFRAYILRFGFLDGWQGYFIAWMDAFSTTVRYTKARYATTIEMESKQSKPKSVV